MQGRAAVTFLTLALLAGPAGAEGRGAQACFAALTGGYEAVRAAAQRSLERCVRRRGGAGESLGACLASDPHGREAAARSAGLATVAAACTPDALPAVGFTSGEAALDAAQGSVRALARGVLGAALDDARLRRRRAPETTACQERVIAAAGRCAAAYASGYGACAAARVAGAIDPFELVACKGSDPGGGLARACDRGVRRALREHCEGVRLSRAFPGCGADAKGCARGHARRSASLALNVAHGLCEGILPGELPEERLLQCFEAPPAERIESALVPLPAGIFPYTVVWDAGGELLVVGFRTFDPAAGMQLGSLHPDGSGFRCLTCKSPIPEVLRPVQILRDGRRVLLAGANGPVPSWELLECEPGLLDCADSRRVPIELPANPDPTTRILQYRVPWLSLDGAWLVWTEVRQRGPGGNLSAMGRLVREAERYAVADARVIAPPLPPLVPVDASGWRSFTQPFEAKYGALRGGRDQVEAGTPDAGQYDAMALDLETGALRRLTRHPDHDEGIQFSPDERWAVLQSGRTDERVEFLGLLPRPPYIDWMAFSIHFVGIAGAPSDGLSPGGDPDERDCYVDPWLLDIWFERGDYLGQRLLRPEKGWVSIEGNASGFGWSPDGTRLALIERRWRDAPEETRLRIASLPARAPLAPEDAVPVAPTPEPSWAVPYEDWIVPDTSGLSVVPGLVSGTATIRNDMPSVLSGELEVVYAGYSDDGASVLDGFERLRIPTLLLAGAEYEVDLSLSGARTGSMRGSISYDFAGDVNLGEVVTELDGVVRRGPRTCYEAGLIPVP